MNLLSWPYLRPIGNWIADQSWIRNQWYIWLRGFSTQRDDTWSNLLCNRHSNPSPCALVFILWTCRWCVYGVFRAAIRPPCRSVWEFEELNPLRRFGTNNRIKASNHGNLILMLAIANPISPNFFDTWNEIRCVYADNVWWTAFPYGAYVTSNSQLINENDFRFWIVK